MDDDLFLFRSEFLPNVVVAVLFKEDRYYPEVKKHFEDLGFGFTALDSGMIFIDGEAVARANEDGMLKLVEAHEISHLLLRHNKTRKEKHEIEADLGAYLLLDNAGHNKSVEILLKHFENRHGVVFNTDLLPEVAKKMRTGFDF